MANKKIFIAVVFYLAHLVKVFAQPIGHPFQEPPLYFVDGVKINPSFVNSLNKDYIAKIDTVKHRNSFTDTIYITCKSHHIFLQWLNNDLQDLREVAQQNIPNFKKKMPVIFSLNDTVVFKPSEIRLPAKTIFKTYIEYADKTSYYKNLPGVVFFKIYTSPPVIYVRGTKASSNLQTK